jgi:hypothetical protein
MCSCSRRRLITIASGLQLNVGLGLLLLGVGGLRLPTVVLWPTLAVICCGLLSVALSYTTLIASEHDKTLFVVGYTGWSFALMFAALATECLVLVAEERPSVQVLCETYGGTPCAEATVEDVGAYYARCGLAARCALGMSILMLSWAVFQQWLHDAEYVDRGREYYPRRLESIKLTSGLLGGFLALLITVGGAGTTGVAGLMAPTNFHVASWHATVIVSVVGGGCLGVVTAVVGALACQQTTRHAWAAEPPPAASIWSCRTACSRGTDIPLLLAVAWICLSTVLFSWSFAEETEVNFGQRWAAHATAWPELTARYCTQTVGALASEQSEYSPFDADLYDDSSFAGELYDRECVLAGFREAQSLYQLAASAIAVASLVQILVVRLLHRAVRADSTSTTGSHDERDVWIMRRPMRVDRTSISEDTHLDAGPV